MICGAWLLIFCLNDVCVYYDFDNYVYACEACGVLIFCGLGDDRYSLYCWELRRVVIVIVIVKVIVKVIVIIVDYCPIYSIYSSMEHLTENEEEIE